jgi:hypothetical protein
MEDAEDFWEADDEDFEQIELLDGSVVSVSAKIRPMLMEWDWTTDPQTGAVVRVQEDGRIVPLFEEHVRISQRFSDSISHPIISRGYIRTQFNQLNSYNSLLSMSAKQREYVMGEFGVALPSASDILQAGLLYSLSGYYRWRAKGEWWVLTPDKENLTPGQLHKQTGVLLPAYDTLGAWLDKEFTGDWRAAPRSPTGLTAVTYGVALDRVLLQWWRDMVEMSDEEVPVRAVERGLRDAGLSVWMLIRYATRAIRSYRLLG